MHSLITKLKTRLQTRGREESGYILIIAILLLFVMTAAVGAMVTASVDLSGQSTDTAFRARAAGAADSGAEVALFRLNQTGTTASGSGTMANGASYSYTVTALTSATSSSCAGLWVENSAMPLNQDCITSEGTVNGISQRVQTRVVGKATVTSTSLFPVNGVFAINGFSSDSVNGAFSLGSNSSLGLTNDSLGSINGQIEYLQGDLSQSQNSNQMCTGTCSLDQLSSVITVPSVADSVYAAAQTSNNDATSGDVSYVNASYNSSTNVLSATNNNASVTFAPGTYYYCGVNYNGFSNFAINTTGAGLVKIYIDSQYRSGSPCTQSGNGQFSDAGNSTDAINSNGISSDLQFYFYGDPGCTTSCPLLISPLNTATIYADIFAPYSSTGQLGNQFTMTGALVIAQIQANNFTFNYQAPGSTGTGTGGATTTGFFPSAHQECVSSTTSGGTTGPC